jgi:predicted acylesterase/phospholipase RssA
MAEESFTQHRAGTQNELAAFEYPKQPSKECDIVMKGGITSGLVYPLAVCELAKFYRFRSVGGASAGAIAASLTAAAEHGRERNGFNNYATLPYELGPSMTKLFVPSNETKRLFDVLLTGVEPTTGNKAIRIARKLARTRFGWFVGGAIVVLLLALPALLAVGGLPERSAQWGQLLIAFVALLPLWLIAGLLAAVVGHALGGKKALQQNYYGLCIGSAGQDAPASTIASPGAFTDWLADKIDLLAGIEGAGPLTFGHLSRKKIDLQVMTTNVTFGRPARFPFSEAASNLNLYMFCPEEWKQFFPKRVFTHLSDKSTDATGGPWVCPTHGVPLRSLPDPDDMPVVVAARISLSFPALISAVPFYAIDYSRKPVRPVRCWFSDGGITSNFPIHFFDSLCPSRPTFGVSLRGYHPDHPESHVYLPGPKATGRLPRAKDTETLSGFFHGIFDTMQNWSDDAQSALPGFRDRVVEIHLSAAQGGMNLAMAEPTITLIAERGQLAGKTLADNFDWPQHRWGRYLTAVSELQQQLEALNEVYTKPLADGPPYGTFIRSYGPLPDHTYERDAAWCAQAAARTAKLLDFLAVATPDFEVDAPRPDPEFRITPHF